MGRGRKSTKVKIITSKDQNLLKQLARTGICTVEQAKSNLGLSINRLSQLAKSGYIKQEKALSNRELHTVYRLHDKGKAYLRSNCPQVVLMLF